MAYFEATLRQQAAPQRQHAQWAEVWTECDKGEGGVRGRAVTLSKILARYSSLQLSEYASLITLQHAASRPATPTGNSMSHMAQ